MSDTGAIILRKFRFVWRHLLEYGPWETSAMVLRVSLTRLWTWFKMGPGRKLAIAAAQWWSVNVPISVRNACYRRTTHILLPAESRLTPQAVHTLIDHADALEWVPGRVVHVCGSLGPGGAERQMVNTVIGLQETPWQSVSLIVNSCAPEDQSNFYLPLLERAGIEVAVTPSERDWPLPAARWAKHAHLLPPFIPADIAYLYDHFRVVRPEVVHAWLDWENIRAGIAALLAGVPRVILSGRNINPSHFPFYRPFMHPAYQALCACPQVTLINNSHAGAKDYEHWLGLQSGTIQVVYNGVDLQHFKRPPTAVIHAFRQRLGIPERAPLITGMFRLAPEKEPLLWLKAAEQISARRPDAHFAIFGRGPLEPLVRKRISRLGSGKTIHLMGVTDKPATALAASTLLMITSAFEGTPNVALEAQMVGTPVISTDAGGAIEAIIPNTTGRIVSSRKSINMATTVIAALDHPELAHGAHTHGRAFVEQRFGMRRMIDETVRLYERPAAEINPAQNVS